MLPRDECTLRRSRFLRHLLVISAATLLVAIGFIERPNPAAQEQNDAADARRLIDLLQLRPGSVVADIGAGSGELTFRLAQHVGPEGRVYSTEIDQQRLDALRTGALKRAHHNIVVVEGAAARTNLEQACCDALFMRHVYHHFGDPPAMNASLYASLKPGGRLAVVDFEPRAGRSAPPGARATDDAHGVMAATVIEELSAAGFAGVQRVEWSSPGYFAVVGQRPSQ